MTRKILLFFFKNRRTKSLILFLNIFICFYNIQSQTIEKNITVKKIQYLLK